MLIAESDNDTVFFLYLPECISILQLSALRNTLRASGYDPNFPRGLDEVQNYIKKNGDKWKTINAPSMAKTKPGDVIFQLYNGGGGHIMVYLGNGKVANAHYVGKTYGIIQSYSSQVHSSYKVLKVYRPIKN